MMEDIFSQMTMRQKGAFLTCLAQLLSDNPTSEEIDYLVDLSIICDYPEDKFSLLFKEISEDDLISMLEEFTSPEHKRLLLRELFYLAYRDEQLNEDEIVYIAFIADVLGVSVEETEEINDWVHTGIEWENKGNLLFGEGV